MLCENCGEREATIHEVLIDASNTKYEKHLCEVCASGGAKPGPAAEAPPPVSELISKFMVGGPTAPPTTTDPGPPGNPGNPAPRGLACSECGLDYSRFKQTGLLGCAACYATFEARLGPLIERAHEGGSHHVGKLPKRALNASRGGGRLDEVLGDQAERTKRIAELRRSLQTAVTGERYEQAAEIKQELERLSLLTDAEPAGDEGAGGAA